MTISNMNISTLKNIQCRTFSDPLYIDYKWTDLRHIIYYPIFFYYYQSNTYTKGKVQKLNGVE